MRIVILTLLATAACHGSPAPTTVAQPPPPPVAKAYPAKLYAGIFVRGAKFEYKTETQDAHYEDTGNVTEKNSGTMTCTVDEVTELPGAIAAQISCDGNISVPVANASPDGTYVATAAGLWRTEAFPTTAPTDPKTMLLAAAPVEKRDVQTDPGEEGFSSETSVTRGSDGEWCWEESSVGGDEGGSKICFANGAISFGTAFFAGGSSHDASYMLTSR